jgi:SAM-dependent methyltransferase
MASRYEDVLDPLRTAYDRAAAARDELSANKSPWKVAERDSFLQRLRSGGSRALLEIGAGTGQDSLFFKEHGLTVVAVDLSAEMVERCRVKGLDARVADFLHMDFPRGSFDAVYAFNCLLHVPNADLPAVLAEIRRLLRAGGLLFIGVYGGDSHEGIADDDDHVPPRFFSSRSDDELRAFVGPLFEIVDFHTVPLQRAGFHFQSLTVRSP